MNNEGKLQRIKQTWGYTDDSFKKIKEEMFYKNDPIIVYSQQQHTATQNRLIKEDATSKLFSMNDKIIHFMLYRSTYNTEKIRR